MVGMTLKELIHYEDTLCSLQQEYENKVGKASGEERKRLVIILNLIIDERQKVNRQKYKPDVK